MKCSLGISNFLEDISSLSHSIVFLYFFALITEEGFLISPCCSLELCIQMGISFLSPLPLAFLLFSAICKASSDNHFAFLHFFILGMLLITASVQCHESPSIALQAVCLSDLIPFIYLSLPLYNIRNLVYLIPEWPRVFFYFLQCMSEFFNKELMIWATVSSWSCFCWLYSAFPSLAVKNLINLIFVMTI